MLVLFCNKYIPFLNFFFAHSYSSYFMFHHSSIRFYISKFIFKCDLGPFRPGIPTNVPLWVAINLKQRQKCRISPPDWLNVGMLPAYCLFIKVSKCERSCFPLFRFPSWLPVCIPCSARGRSSPRHFDCSQLHPRHLYSSPQHLSSPPTFRCTKIYCTMS